MTNKNNRIVEYVCNHNVTEDFFVDICDLFQLIEYADDINEVRQYIDNNLMEGYLNE